MLKSSFFLFVAFVFCQCSVSKQINRTAGKTIIKTEALKTAHVGISVFEPATNRYWYNYQGDHYFIPASNVKIPTCYAAMKYLGDSIVGLRYGIPEENWFKEHGLVIQPTGDPTFLHKDYPNQTVFDFLKENLLVKQKKPGLLINNNEFERWGSGWSWDDYLEPYMTERSSFPVFGSTISVSLHDTAQRFVENPFTHKKTPRLFTTGIRYFDSLLTRSHIPIADSELKKVQPRLKITRGIDLNHFNVEKNEAPFQGIDIPFVTNDLSTAMQVIKDTFKTKFALVEGDSRSGEYYWDSDDGDIMVLHINKWSTIRSQPTDSVLRPMMHKSDNFLAEQSLLMVSNEMLGVMNDQKIIDTLLKTDLKDLPQTPRWADGSGLSRYNLFTPQDLVLILHKMKTGFGMDRMKHLFPTGGQGSLQHYFVPDSGFIYAKTGSMSGVLCLSGFLYTQKSRLLFFSVLINNHRAPVPAVRRAVETFLQGIRRRY